MPKLAAQAHELGLPCVICELHFVIFTLRIYPFHVCKYNVIDNKKFFEKNKSYASVEHRSVYCQPPV